MIARQKDPSGKYMLPPGDLFNAPVLDLDYRAPRRIGQLAGCSVWVSNSIPITETQGTASTATTILYGDFSHCWVLKRQGVQLFASQDQLPEHGSDRDPGDDPRRGRARPADRLRGRLRDHLGPMTEELIRLPALDDDGRGGYRQAPDLLVREVPVRPTYRAVAEAALEAAVRELPRSGRAFASSST